MKERLTGAIILVALIVLWVPELLTGPIRSAPRAAALTPAGEPPLRSYTINLTDDAHARPSGPEPPAPLAAPAPPEGAAAESPPAALPPTPAQDLRAEPAPAPAQPPSAAPSTAAPGAASTAGAMRAAAAPATSGARAMGVAGAWMVQLGSFASRSNAEHLARQVRAQGFQASVSQGTSGRRLYRVRVGPAHDRTAATQLAQKLRASGHSGELVPR